MKLIRNVITGEFELENGEKVAYKLNAVKQAENIQKAAEMLKAAGQSDDINVVGPAFVDTLTSFYGEAVTSRLVDFFTDDGEVDYSDLMLALSPAIINDMERAAEIVKAKVNHANQFKGYKH